jgi:hypothetical protein
MKQGLIYLTCLLKHPATDIILASMELVLNGGSSRFGFAAK